MDDKSFDLTTVIKEAIKDAWESFADKPNRNNAKILANLSLDYITLLDIINRETDLEGDTNPNKPAVCPLNGQNLT